MPDVRIATFNVENLFARYRFKDRSIDVEQAVRDGWDPLEVAFDLMSPAAKAITGKAIRATRADVIALQEVETLATLRRFRSEFLGGSRAFPHAFLVEGNDDNRLIDVAVLSRHPIVHGRSWAHLRDGVGEVFSRDCLEVDVLVDGTRLTLFVQHYKSMVGGRGATAEKRRRQVDATLQIVGERFGARAGDAPFVVLGDFNDYMASDREGDPAIGALVGWDQVENVVQRLPEPERWTHYYRGGNDYKQLDRSEERRVGKECRSRN